MTRSRQGLDAPLPSDGDTFEADDPRTLRPPSWDDYIGQAELTRSLRIKCRAAFELKRPLGHLLISGPMGSGKTTLAHLAAAETGDTVTVISRPVGVDDLMQALWDLPSEVGILFLDEAHQQPSATQHALLTLTEEQFIQSKWGHAKFPWVTVVMATTEKQDIRLPLQSRFTVLDMEPYTAEDMQRIVTGMAERAGVDFNAETCAELALAACGVPRAARHLVLAGQELAAVGEDVTVASVLRHVGLEADGLSRDHLAYLGCLRDLGGQVGLTTIANRLQLHTKQVQRLERLLVDRGFVKYNRGGRMLVGAGRARLDGLSTASVRGGRFAEQVA